jgi:hypothetical protein
MERRMGSEEQLERRDDLPPEEAEARRTDGGRLTTADVAGTGAPSPEAHQASNVEERDPGARRPAPAARDEAPVSLFDQARSEEFRGRWDSIQASFVDEPRDAVSAADALVAEVLKELARTFADERESLEKEWTLGDQVSTEDLRQALRQYRSFFDRLLSL